MKLIIVKTNIPTKKKVKKLEPLFNNYSGILKWSVDTEDIDKVLRIEAQEHVEEHEIAALIGEHGYFLEEMEN